MPRSIKQQVLTRQRQAHALELRRQGHTYDEIASQVGYAGPGAAWKAVHRAVREIGRDEARDLAVLQLERLNDMLAEAWPVATDSSHPRQLQAIETTMRIMDRMDRLHGI